MDPQDNNSDYDQYEYDDDYSQSAQNGGYADGEDYDQEDTSGDGDYKHDEDNKNLDNYCENNSFSDDDLKRTGEWMIVNSEAFINAEDPEEMDGKVKFAAGRFDPDDHSDLYTMQTYHVEICFDPSSRIYLPARPHKSKNFRPSSSMDGYPRRCIYEAEHVNLWLAQGDTSGQPPREVVDYVTAFSGLTADHLKQGRPFREVQEEVVDILKGKILVIHDRIKDFEVLGYQHPEEDIRDTSIYPPLTNYVRGKFLYNHISLKRVAGRILSWDIQQGSHCSVVDARAAMFVYRQWVDTTRAGWPKGWWSEHRHDN